jgi:nucleoside-diphosphate-sugar epimerase
MNDTVLVTGATGFLAQHCIVALLEAGYLVRGTARRAGDSAARIRENVAPLLGAAARERLAALRVFPADLLADAGFREAAEGCRYVLHVASPLPAQPPRNERELIEPARDGALRVLRAALDAGVQRVVMTSSIAAVMRRDERARRFSEADWSDLASPHATAYEKSKHVAEKAAWDFVAQLPAERRFELVVINPGLMLGPIFGGEVSTSGLVVKKLLARELPACPDIHFALVDVRDVAAAHVTALSVREAAGQRFICANDDRSIRDVARVLQRRFAADGLRIPTRALPDFAFRVLALFDPSLRLVAHFLGIPERVDNHRIREVLGWQPRPIEASIIEMAQSMLDQGVVNARKPVGPALSSQAHGTSR